MENCDNCGYKLEPGMTVCPICGKKFETEKKPDEKEKAEQKPEQRPQPEPPLMEAEEDEEGTTVLVSKPMAGKNNLEQKKNDDGKTEDDGEEGTTVLTENLIPAMPKGMGPQGPGMGMPNGMGPQGPGMGMPNGMGPQGPGMGMPNGMGPQGPGMGMPNGMQPGQTPDGKKKASKQKPPKQKAPKQKKQQAPKQKEQKAKKKMGTGAKVTLITIPAVIIIAAAVCAILFVPKFADYKKAQDALNDGNVKEAVELYSGLGNFKDAEEMAGGGAYYEYADRLFAEKDYKGAAENYKEAAKQMYLDSDTKEKECYYKQADTLFASGDYEGAAALYTQAKGYNDAATKILECAYKNGEKLLEAKDFDGAIAAFQEAADYEDAAEKVKECTYNKALVELAEGQINEAYDDFMASEYSDYSDKAMECLFQLAEGYKKEGNYEMAIDTYGKIDPAYKDCVAEQDECYIAWAKQLSTDKDYKGAIEKYSMVQKKDVSKKINKAKESYCKEHFKPADELTIEYLCDLKYAEYGTAKEDYKELLGWNVESFVNSKQDDYDTRNDSVKKDSAIYVHTIFTNSDNMSINLKAQIQYADGSKSETIDFGKVSNKYVSWLTISPDAAVAGETILYIYDSDTGRLFEKYVFTIK